MKLLLTCTSGGHFATMKDLQNFWSNYDRTWVTHLEKDTAVIQNAEVIRWIPYQGPRDIFSFLKNLPTVFDVVKAEKPDLIISTGASIAVSFAIVAKLLGIRFIYIESITRSQDLSLSGKLVYHLCDDFYVQWPQLTQKYSKSKFMGYV